MALQTSGAISFANLQTEFGGSHPITMGEYASFRVSGSGNTISMNQFYGASASLDTQTVTVGSKYQYYQTWRGYWPQISIGSISDGTSNIYGGASIAGIVWSSQNRVFFYVSGIHSNSGWSTMQIGSTTLNRTSGSYTTTSTNLTYWLWTSVSDPFSSNGTNTTVVFN